MIEATFSSDFKTSEVKTSEVKTPDVRRPRIVRPSDLRRHQRVKVALLGRYMLSDRQEYPCQTIDVSPGGALVVR